MPLPVLPNETSLAVPFIYSRGALPVLPNDGMKALWYSVDGGLRLRDRRYRADALLVAGDMGCGDGRNNVAPGMAPWWRSDDVAINIFSSVCAASTRLLASCASAARAAISIAVWACLASAVFVCAEY